MGRPERPIDPAAGPVADFAAELRKLREEAGRPNYRELARRASFSVTVLSEAAGGRCLPTLPVVRGYVQACGGDLTEWEERWRLAAAREQRAHQQAHEESHAIVGVAGRSVDLAGPSSSGPASPGMSIATETSAATGVRTAVATTNETAAVAAEAPGRAVSTRPARRHGRLVVVLVVLLAAACMASGAAAWQYERAVGARNAAMSGQLAAQSTTLATAHPVAAALAALAAWQASHTVAARSALLSLAACCTAMQASLDGEHATVNAVALSPGGKLVAAGGDDRAVHLWDTATGRQIAAFGGFAGPVRTIAFSSHGNLLAAGSDDHTIRLWNTTSHTSLGVLGHATAAVEGLAFSPNGTLLASVSADGQILLWNPATHRLEQTLTQHQPGHEPADMLSVAFSPDGNTLAAAGDGHVVALWNIADLAHPTITQWLTGATGVITHLAYSPTGTMIAAEQTGGDALLWNLGHHGPDVLPNATGNSHGLAFNRDGTILITAGSDKHLLLWNAVTGRQAGSDPRRIPGDANGLAYDPASGSLALGGPTGSVQFWQAPIPPFAGSTGPVTGLARVPGTTMLASVSSDDVLSLWNRDGSRVATTMLSKQPAAIAASPAGKLLATIDDDGTLTLLGIPELDPTLSLNTTGPPATDVAFSPDGKMLATAARGTVAVRYTGRETPLHKFYSYYHGYFEAVAFSPDGRTLAAATVRGTLMLWNVRTDKKIAEVDAGTGQAHTMAFSPDGQTLATAGNKGRITLWDAATLDRRAVITGRVGPIQALTYSPNGQILASAERNGTIMLWDTANLSPVATLTGDNGAVNALAFSPDGSTLISGQNSNGIIVWNLNPIDAVRQACRTLASDPGISQAETLVPGATYTRVCPGS